jgi:hypothetical protein
MEDTKDAQGLILEEILMVLMTGLRPYLGHWLYL